MTDEPPTLLLVGLIFALLPAWAGDSGAPWGKDPAQWTENDVQVVLTVSPWAQSASAVMADPRDEIERTPAPLPGPAQAGMAGQTNPTGNSGRWDGSIGRNRMGRLPSLSVLVRWDSAAPVREALRRASNAHDAQEPEDYVITIAGLIPAGHYRSGGATETASRSGGTTGLRSPEEIIAAFMSASRLEPRGAPAIRPKNVKLDSETGTVHVFFSRSASLEQSAKEVTFATRFGGFSVRAKFRVKDMKFQGKVAL